MTVIQNLTNSIVNMGKEMVKAITVDPLKQGFEEYELKLGSIQTIMAGTGESLETVNSYLNELNTYADRTIYSFADMTTNIGKFTNAGVSLKGSVAAIQGVANVAALSGANANEASRAMYNFAQALSAGYVKLIDWKSIENANMATVGFKTQLLETAVAVGTLTKTTDGFYRTAKGTIIGATKGFNEALEQQWLTTEVLTGSLQKYSDETTDIGKAAFAAAQDVKTFTQMIDTVKEALGSGWAMTWELVIGDFNEAKSLFTEINNILSGLIDSSAKSRNTLLSNWKMLGGRDALVAALRQSFQAVLNIMSAVSEVLETLFPPMTAGQLYNFTVLLLNAAIAFKQATEDGERLKRIFKGIASVFQIGFQIIEAVVGSLLRLAGVITGPLIVGLDFSLDGILNFLAGIGDWLVGLKDTLKEQDTFNKGIQKIGEFIGLAAYNVQYFAGVISTEFQNAMAVITPYVQRAITALKEFATVAGPWISQALVDVNVALEPLKTAFDELAQKIGPSLNTVMEEIRKQFEKVDPTKVGEDFVSFGEKVKTALAPLKGVFEALGKVFGWFGRILEKLAPQIKIAGEWLAGAFKTLGEKIENFVDNIDFNRIGEILKNGLLAALVLAIANFFREGGEAMGGVSELLEGVKDSLEAWQNSLKARTLLEIAAALAILTASIVVLSTIDQDKLMTALTSMTVMFGELVASMKILDQAKGGGLKTASLQLIVLATGLFIFSKAVEALSKIDQDQFMQGLIGVGVLLGELSIFMKTTSNQSLPQAGSLLGFALALGVLSLAVRSFSGIDPKEMTKSLIAIGVLLGEVAIFSKVIGDKANLVQASVAITILSGALLIMSLALKALGNLSWEELGLGITALGVSLGLIATVLKGLDEGEVIKASVAITIMSGAMLVLAGALKALGNLSLDEIGNGLMAMGGALTIFAVALSYMKGTLPAAAAILVVVGALTMLVPILLILGNLPIAVIGIALGALAAGFFVMGTAGLILGPLVPVFLGLGIALSLFSIAAMGAGIAITMFAGALATVTAMGAGAAVAMSLVLQAFLSVVPQVVTSLLNAIAQFADGMASAAPKLVGAAVTALTAVVNGIISTAGMFIAAIGQIIVVVLNTLVANAPKIVEAGFQLLISLLTGLRDHIEEIVPLVIDIVLKFVASVTAQLPKIIESGFKMMISFFDGLADGVENNLPALLKSIGHVASAIIEGLANGITAGVGQVLGAIGDLGNQALSSLKGVLGIQSPSKETGKIAKYFVSGFVITVKESLNSVGNAAKDLGKTAVSTLSKAMSKVGDTLNNDLELTPTIRPIVDLTDVKLGSRQINDLLANSVVDISGTTNKLSRVVGGMRSSSQTSGVNPTKQAVSQVTFQQNNYSPKALSRFEIYRQNKNLLKMMEGLVPN